VVAWNEVALVGIIPRLFGKTSEISIEKEVRTKCPVEVSEFCLMNLDAVDKLLGKRCNVVKISDHVFYGRALGFYGKVQILESRPGRVKYLGGAGNWALHANAEITIEYMATTDNGTYAKCKLTAFASGVTSIILTWLKGALASAAAMMVDDASKVSKMIQEQPERVKQILTDEQWRALQKCIKRGRRRCRRTRRKKAAA
jgi:hypothetical protein